MDVNKLNIGDILKEAWKFTKEHLGFLVAYFIITIVISVLFSFVAAELEERDSTFLAVLMHLAGAVVNVFISMGLYRSALMITAGEKPGFNQLYANDQNFISWILAGLVVGIMILVGLILLVIPGLYVMAKYLLFPYFLLDRNLGPIESLQETAKATKGKVGFLFLLLLVCFLLNVVGFLLLGIGLLITVPLTTLAMAVAYRKITTPASELPATIVE